MTARRISTKVEHYPLKKTKKEEKNKEKISSFDDDGNIKTSNMAADREKKEERRDRRERGRDFDRRDVYRRDKSTGNRKEIIEATSKDIGRHKRLFQVGITGLQENIKLDKKKKVRKRKMKNLEKMTMNLYLNPRKANS